MDKLSRFGNGEGGKTLDDVVDGLTENTAQLGGILRQLDATHKGHEVEDWGKEVPILTVAEALEEADESESPFDTD